MGVTRTNSPGKRAIVGTAPGTPAPVVGATLTEVPRDGERPQKTGPDFQTKLNELKACIASADWDGLEKRLPDCMAENAALTAGYLDAALPSRSRDVILPRVVQLWAARSPLEALEWTVKLKDFDEIETLVGVVYLKWAETAPQAAVAAETKIGALGASRGDVLRNLTGQWAERDLTAASAWVVSQPADDLRAELIEQIAIRLTKTDPSKAAKLVVKEIPVGTRQNEAIIAVLHQWALRDMEKAKVWALHFPADEVLSVKIRNELDGIGMGL